MNSEELLIKILGIWGEASLNGKQRKDKDCFLHSSETGFTISTGEKGMEESPFFKVTENHEAKNAKED